MTLDRYVPCPGGTGKKIKFCCADFVTELDHIHRMLEGQQRLACLEYVRKTRAAHPDRACLLAIQCLLESELEQLDNLKQTLATFEQKHPANPVMLAELALYRAETEGSRAGLEPLQRAIEASGDEMPSRVYAALGALGRLLLGEGWIVAARAHLLLHAALAGTHDTSAMSLLTRLNRAADVPLLLKEDHPLKAAPEGMSQRGDFEQALSLAHRGAWLLAAEAFAALSQQQANVPAIWHNLAVLRAYLADHPAAVAALRRFSGLDVAWDDAVEAEALAQLLDEQRPGDLTDIVALTYTIEDVAATQTRLAADRRVWRLPVDLASLAEADQPPPVGAFRLLDRPLPETGVGLSRDDVPRVLAEIFLFGKQTDRPARLELLVGRGPEMDAGCPALADVLGRELGPASGEEVVRRVSALQHALSWRWQLPADTPPQQRAKMGAERQRHTILEDWTALSNPTLQGKTPRDAAGDAALRIPLAAAVLNLEQAMLSTAVAESDLFATLRSQLGLPLPDPIDPSGVDVHALPAVRLARLKVEPLSDDDLLECYQLAGWLHIAPALARLAAEVVRRPSLDQKVDKAEAYGLLAQVTGDRAEQFQYIDQARRAAEAQGESSAPWDLAELAAAVEFGDQERFGRLLTHVRTQHMNEPGVAEALLNLLQRLGLVGPDGRGRAAASAASEAGPSLVLPGEQSAAAAGQLWTPESAAPSAGSKKSVIWTPGSP